MNRSNRILYLLAVAVVATSCGREGRHHSHLGEQSVTINREWPAAGINHLRVFEVAGNVKIEAAPVDKITLVANASGELDIKKGAENDGLFETKITDGTLSIGRHRERKGFEIPFLFDDDDDVEIDYTLKVPPTVSLDMNTVNGRIATKGVEGETRAVTVNGSIDLENAGTHEVAAVTVNGRVRAKFTRSFQGARFKTVNGGVEASLPQSASFNVNLSQVNGDFEAAFPLNIHSNPGSRRVSGDVNGGEHELKIVTVNGDIELSRNNDSL